MATELPPLGAIGEFRNAVWRAVTYHSSDLGSEGTCGYLLSEDQVDEITTEAHEYAGGLAEQATAAERKRWMAVLTEHYLAYVICNPETKRDNPVCGCSLVFLGWHPSVGAARQAWIDHVAAVVAGEGR